MDEAHAENMARAFLSHDYKMIQESLDIRHDLDALIAHNHSASEMIKQAL